jgi:ribosomal protein S18 acetylase RimI-like enzyme
VTAIEDYDMDIRLAAIEDAEGIADVHIKSWQYAYRGILPDVVLDALDINKRINAWNTLLSDSSGSAYVAIDGTGSIKGFVHICRSRDNDLDNDIVGEVTAIYIDPDAIGKGIGAKLFSTALEHLRRTGHSKISLWVLEENKLGVDFYIKFGFKPDGEKKVHPKLGLVELRFSC